MKVLRWLGGATPAPLRPDSEDEAALAAAFLLPDGFAWLVREDLVEIARAEGRPDAVACPKDIRAHVVNVEGFETARLALMNDPDTFGCLRRPVAARLAELVGGIVFDELFIGQSVKEAKGAAVSVALSLACKPRHSSHNVWATRATPEYRLRQFSLLARVPLPQGWHWEFTTDLSLVVTDGKRTYEPNLERHASAADALRALANVAGALRTDKAPQKDGWSRVLRNRASQIVKASALARALSARGIDADTIVSLVRGSGLIRQLVDEDRKVDAMAALAPMLGADCYVSQWHRSARAVMETLLGTSVNIADMKLSVYGYSVPAPRSASAAHCLDTLDELAAMADSAEFAGLIADVEKRTRYANRQEKKALAAVEDELVRVL